jgi:hypothetical protein
MRKATAAQKMATMTATANGAAIGIVSGECSFAPGKMVGQQDSADRFSHASFPPEGKVDFGFIW